MLTIALTLAMTIQKQVEAPDWSALAQSDIAFMHEQTLAHHPGPVDVENPDFSDVMTQALERGLELAAQAESQAGYAMAVRAYAAQYRDGHYGVNVSTGVEAYQWPGFVSVRVGGRWFAMDDGASNASLDGSEILDCDGRAIDDWMHERVFGFYGDPALEADWSRRAPQLMVDLGNPFVSRPTSCRFLDGSAIEVRDLNWQDIGVDQWWALADAASASEEAPWGVREFAPDVFWIGVPTFWPQGDALNLMQALQDDLEARAEALRNADILVFDVRGNNGGSSSWGDSIVSSVWGEAFAAYRTPVSSSGVDFRVSSGNIDHARAIIDLTVEQDMPEAEAYFREVLAGMLAAQAAGEPLYVERNAPEPPAPSAPNPVSARVYFLTDSACGSACLDFADRMYAIENVVHIGGETYADSAYMEFRPISLPSGRGSLSLPIKVYRERPRASGQSYTPAIDYPGTDWSTSALEAWVTALGH